MNKSIPPFYVGQRVVAIQDHSQLDFKKGDEFTVHSVSYGCCGWDVTIGITINHVGLWVCVRCSNKSIILKGDEIKYAASRFAPITSTFQSIEYREVLEKEREFVSAN